jgi:hypothetical protein
MEKIYAFYELGSGRVTSIGTRTIGILPLDAAPEDNRPRMVRDGVLLDCPAAVIIVPGEPIVANHPAEFAIELPANIAELADTIPSDGLELMLYADTAPGTVGMKYRWPLDPKEVAAGTTHFTTKRSFPEPGEFNFRVIGPWPWSSAAVKFIVLATDPAVDDRARSMAGLDYTAEIIPEHTIEAPEIF